MMGGKGGGRGMGYGGKGVSLLGMGWKRGRGLMVSGVTVGNCRFHLCIDVHLCTYICGFIYI
jgi:hypothetical protein